MCERYKVEVVGFEQNSEFNTILSELKKDGVFAHTRKLNPQSKKSAKTTFYAESIVEELRKQYECQK